MKFKLLRNDIGCAICEDCKEYSPISRMCRLDRKSSDASDECEDFKRAYEVVGCHDGSGDLALKGARDDG